MSDVQRLISSKSLGLYNFVEVTEIFAQLPSGEVTNVFTLMVAEDRPEQDKEQLKFLTKSRLKLNGLKDWSFGILRYSLSIDELERQLEQLDKEGDWSSPGSQSIRYKNLSKLPYRYVPIDATETVSLNNVLKNNFFNGSYIVEWFDLKKELLFPLVEDKKGLIQQLSEKVSGILPINIAAVSDRLGSFVLQVPPNNIRVKLDGNKKGQTVNVSWRKECSPKKLRFNYEQFFDNTIEDYGSYDLIRELDIPSLGESKGMFRWSLFDQDSDLILAACSSTAYTESIHMSSNIVLHGAALRYFELPDGEYCELSPVEQLKSIVGKDSDALGSYDSWTRKRKYRDEKANLAFRKEFVQYPSLKNDLREAHRLAILDIRDLINRYGQKSVWLWDPFLSVEDIMKTLFFCHYTRSDLRAITALKHNDDNDEKAYKENLAYIEKQKQQISNVHSNFLGMKLEVRARFGDKGWNFHDRFLIFPETDRGPLAWSLGTSLNSFGKSHHILQLVHDGGLIADAFSELWAELSDEENRLWKI